MLTLIGKLYRTKWDELVTCIAKIRKFADSSNYHERCNRCFIWQIIAILSGGEIMYLRLL